MESLCPTLCPSGIDLLRVSAIASSPSPSPSLSLLLDLVLFSCAAAQKMLIYDPHQRISARRAMEHPYFDDLDKTALF